MAFQPSSAALSGMPTGSKYMGWWGDMGGPKQKGITSYVVSPMRQASLRGVVKHAIFQGYARTLAQAPYFLVPIALGYVTLKWAIADNDLRNSKAGHIQGKFV